MRWRSVEIGVICVLLLAISGIAQSQSGDGTQSIYAFLLCGDSNGQGLLNERPLFIAAVDRMLDALKTGWGVPAANIAPPCYAWENTAAEFHAELGQLAKLADADDIVIFYYAGHGGCSGPGPLFKDGQPTSFVSIDIELKNAAGEVVVILDACESGCAVSQMSTESRWFLTAAREGQDTCIRTSPIGLGFTKYFTDAIKESDGNTATSLREAYDSAVSSLQQLSAQGIICSVKTGPADATMWPETGDLTPVHGITAASPEDISITIRIISVSPRSGWLNSEYENGSRFSVTIEYELRGVSQGDIMAGVGPSAENRIDPICRRKTDDGSRPITPRISEGTGRVTISGYIVGLGPNDSGDRVCLQVCAAYNGDWVIEWLRFPEYSYRVR